MAEQNYSMASGDSKQLIVTIVDDAGAPVDVTGGTVVYVIADREVRVTKTTGDGVVIDESTVTVTLDPADTAALAGLYGHEMQVTDVAGHVYTVLTGQVSIAKDVIV